MAKLTEVSRFTVTGIGLALLSGCTNDLIIGYGKGDAIKFKGQGDSFDCTDPAYASVKKIGTASMYFHDGQTMNLCITEEAYQARLKSKKAEYMQEAIPTSNPSLALPATGSAKSAREEPHQQIVQPIER